MPKDEFHYDIKQRFGDISKHESSTGAQYSKEVNLISYNDANPSYDIRNWVRSADGSIRMGKGITLSLEELQKLKEILNDMEDLDQ